MGCFLKKGRIKEDKDKVFILISLILVMVGDLSSKIWEFQQEIEKDPDNFTAHHNLGICHYLKGDLDSAEEKYRLSLEFDVERKMAYMNHVELSEVHVRRGNLDLAIQEAENAIDSIPDFFVQGGDDGRKICFAQSYNSLGLLFFNKAKRDSNRDFLMSAKEYLEKSLELTKDPTPRENLELVNEALEKGLLSLGSEGQVEKILPGRN